MRYRRRRDRRVALARAAVVAGVAAGLGTGWAIEQSQWWQSTASEPIARATRTAGRAADALGARTRECGASNRNAGRRGTSNRLSAPQVASVSQPVVASVAPAPLPSAVTAGKPPAPTPAAASPSCRRQEHRSRTGRRACEPFGVGDLPAAPAPPAPIVPRAPARQFLRPLPRVSIVPSGSARRCAGETDTGRYRRDRY